MARAEALRDRLQWVAHLLASAAWDASAGARPDAPVDAQSAHRDAGAEKLAAQEPAYQAQGAGWWHPRIAWALEAVPAGREPNKPGAALSAAQSCAARAAADG